MHGLMITVAAAAAACLLIGAARIAAWVMDRREHEAARPAREMEFSLQASIEVCNLAADRDYSIAMLDQEAMSEDYCDASRWTPAEEAAYQRQIARHNEIEASKRGDLIAAACFAELAEVDRG